MYYLKRQNRQKFGQSSKENLNKFKTLALKKCHTWKSGENFLNSKGIIATKTSNIQKQR